MGRNNMWPLRKVNSMIRLTIEVEEYDIDRKARVRASAAGVCRGVVTGGQRLLKY